MVLAVRDDLKIVDLEVDLWLYVSLVDEAVSLHLETVTQGYMEDT